MSSETTKKSPARKLWLLVAGLAAIYLIVLAGVRAQRPHVKTPGIITPSAVVVSDCEGLAKIAVGQAEGRVPGAQFQTGSTQKKTFNRDTLADASPSDPNAVSGCVIVIDAQINNKTVDKLTYHAANNRAVFVKEEQVK